MLASLRKLKSFKKENINDFYHDIKEVIIESKAFSNIEYIGIAGSIGRGEKSIFDDELNDIDFIVVGKIEDEKIKSQIEKRLCCITNTEYTDITVINRKLINENFSVIHQYLFDFINGNVDIYSSNSLKYEMTKLREKKIRITRFSIINLFITRSFCLDVNITNNDESYFFRYQLRKVILAYIDSFLIYLGEYKTTTCQKKIEIVGSKYSNEAWFIDAKYYIENYKNCNYFEMKEFTKSVYKMHSYLIKKECKFDIVCILGKLFILPTPQRYQYTIKVFKLLFWRKK